MAEPVRETWITGIGIVTCLGEGPEAHWRALNACRPVIDTSANAPYIVHPLPPTKFDEQIPRKSDQRQMELWQRIGAYAAGLALDSAGLKGRPEALERMDMIIAAGGGERDLPVDCAVLSGLATSEHPDRFLNERLMSDLRPTLFLAQLSNLLAGNISIVHGVTGSSRTFMGEEAAGVDALRVAFARIAAGQSELTLIGGSYNGDRKDQILLREFGGHALKGEFRPVWSRGPKGGFAPGSLGAFLVLEDRAHAERRGARGMARLRAVASDQSRRPPGGVSETLERLWKELPIGDPRRAAFISGASGSEPATNEEREFLNRHPTLAVRATGTHVGHGLEPQFPLNVAIAALALQQGRLFAPCDPSGFERPMDGPLEQVVVTGVGHWRGEGLALVEQVR